jgi:hypothetical protein
MLHAPIPANDDARWQALRELLILDTPPKEAVGLWVGCALGLQGGSA